MLDWSKKESRGCTKDLLLRMLSAPGCGHLEYRRLSTRIGLPIGFVKSEFGRGQ